MTTPTITDYLKYANLQMALDALLDMSASSYYRRQLHALRQSVKRVLSCYQVFEEW